MRKIILSLLLIVSFVLSIRASEEHLLPKPQIANFSDSEKFAIFYGVKLMLPTITENDPAVDKQLHTLVKTYGGKICNRSEQEIVVNLVAEVKGAEFQEEAYNLVVTNSKITINAKTLRGAYWAVQTLWQLAEGTRGEIPACEIIDWPSFRVRGYMHDVGRSYIEFEELKNEIVKMSRFKVNTFHWHLTDNQGCCLERMV